MVTIAAPTTNLILQKIRKEEKRQYAAPVDSREQHVAQVTNIYGTLTVETIC